MHLTFDAQFLCKKMRGQLENQFPFGSAAISWVRLEPFFDKAAKILHFSVYGHESVRVTEHPALEATKSVQVIGHRTLEATTARVQWDIGRWRPRKHGSHGSYRTSDVEGHKKHGINETWKHGGQKSGGVLGHRTSEATNA